MSEKAEMDVVYVFDEDDLECLDEDGNEVLDEDTYAEDPLGGAI